jgi:hypothetical protein
MYGEMGGAMSIDMRRGLLFAALLFSAVMAALPAAAQVNDVQKLIVLRPKFMFMAEPSILAELKLNEEQQRKIRLILTDVLIEDDSTAGIKITPDLDVPMLEKDVMAVLTYAQAERARELWLQFSGTAALIDPEIAKLLRLDDDQKKRVAEIFEELAGELEAYYRNAGETVDRKQAQSIRQKHYDRLYDLLKAPQKKRWEILKGAPPKKP